MFRQCPLSATSGRQRRLSITSALTPRPQPIDEAATKIVEDVKRETAGPWHRGFGRGEG